MRKIVTGLFETYDDARRAQDALLLKGFAATDIELPVPGTEAATGKGADAASGGGHGILAGLERFLSSLFTSRPSGADPTPAGDDARTASMRFALQRGAVLIGVRVPDDAHAIVARDTLVQQQALQVDEHDPAWRPDTTDPDALREHSALDELGIGGLPGASRQATGREPVNPVPEDPTLRPRYGEFGESGGFDETTRPGGLADRPADDPAVTALSPPIPADDVQATVLGGEASVPPPPIVSAPASVPDEFLEYEEDFRGHHATRYVDEGAPFERYADAYRYGVGLAQDASNQGRSWVDIEPDARRGWETMASGTVSRYSWDQVRDAARHGWERACAQGGCA